MDMGIFPTYQKEYGLRYFIFLRPSRMGQATIFCRLHCGCFKNRFVLPDRDILRRGGTVITRLSRELGDSVANIIIDCRNVGARSSAGLEGRLHRGSIGCAMMGGALLSHTYRRTNLSSVGPILRNAATVTADSDRCTTTTEVLYGCTGSRSGFGIGSTCLSNTMVSVSAVITLSGLPAERILLTGILNTFRTPVTSFTHTMRTVISGNNIRTYTTRTTRRTPTRTRTPTTRWSTTVGWGFAGCRVKNGLR